MRLTDAQRTLVEDNRGLAYNAARRFIRRFPEYQHLEEDLCQEALLGLVAASTTFDPSLASFSKYGWEKAYTWASQYALANRNPVYVPRRKRVAVHAGIGAIPLDLAEDSLQADDRVMAKDLLLKLEEGVREKLTNGRDALGAARWLQKRHLRHSRPRDERNGAEIRKRATRDARIFMEHRMDPSVNMTDIGKRYGMTRANVSRICIEGDAAAAQWLADEEQAA